MEELASEFESARERCLLVALQQRDCKEHEVAEHLGELARLACTAGGEVCEEMTFKRDKPHPGYFVGEGQAELIAEEVEKQKIATVIFDDELTPAQGRNIERVVKAKVLDRTQLILDIFARHAATRAGRLQIELARMQYTLPRLRRMWTHLERQRGGIGLRGGPGEQQIEVDRRLIEERITRLRGELEGVRKHRAERRKGRRRHGWALVSLVGYTNAGKSTLLNRIADAEVKADDKLFATLDPTTRRIKLPNNQDVLLTDTVGFIRKLPHGLIESFRATLEEVSESDLLLHVVDTSNPEAEAQIAAVEDVLREIGADDKPLLMVLNKCDRKGSGRQAACLRRRFGQAVEISARDGDGIDDLQHALADALKYRNTELHLRIPISEGGLISSLQASANILDSEYDGDFALFRVRVPERLLGDCKAYIIS